LDLDGKQFINVNKLVRNTILSFNINMQRAENIATEVKIEARQRALTLPGGMKGLHNGVGDAWRHARWNQRMVDEIDTFTAFFAGWGHEIVDNLLKGSPLNEVIMDAYNNAKGRTGVHPDILLQNNELMIIDGPGRNNPYEGDKRCGHIK